MQRKIEIIASSVEEAMELAVEKLHLPSDKIFINVLGELPTGLNCEAMIDINLTLEGKRYLEGILRALNIGYQLEARSINDETEIHYMINSTENPLLIGARGKTLEAIQTLVRNVISMYSKERIVTTLDIGSYKINRNQQLEIIATKTAKEVVRSGIEVKLKPMNAYERRIIHEKLSEWRDVYTESEGEGTERALIIKPKKKA